MRKLDQFFKPKPTPSQLPSVIIQTLPPSVDAITNLNKRLKEVNQQCSITKSRKGNRQIFTYDYLRFLSIQKYIQLLLEEEGKMNASNQIAQTVWNKGDYMVRCIRKWRDYFIKTGELFVYRQGIYTKLESLLNDEDFKEACQARLWQQTLES